MRIAAAAVQGINQDLNSAGFTYNFIHTINYCFGPFQLFFGLDFEQNVNLTLGEAELKVQDEKDAFSMNYLQIDLTNRP